jgi:hypothetical protein
LQGVRPTSERGVKEFAIEDLTISDEAKVERKATFHAHRRDLRSVAEYCLID